MILKIDDTTYNFNNVVSMRYDIDYGVEIHYNTDEGVKDGFAVFFIVETIRDKDLFKIRDIKENDDVAELEKVVKVANANLFKRVTDYNGFDKPTCELDIIEPFKIAFNSVQSTKALMGTV